MKFNLIYTNCYCFKRIIEISKNLGYVTYYKNIFCLHMWKKLNIIRYRNLYDYFVIKYFMKYL